MDLDTDGHKIGNNAKLVSSQNVDKWGMAKQKKSPYRYFNEHICKKKCYLDANIGPLE